MKKFGNLIALSLLFGFLAGNTAFSQYNQDVKQPESSSNVMKADVKSERIPAGTVFDIRMETPVNSNNYLEGDTFRSTLLEDIRIGNAVVLPAGTMLRGTVNHVKPASRFTRGGEVGLSFDHAVTPFGKQIPLMAKVSKAKQLNPDGVFDAGGGYLNAVNKNFDKGANILTTTTQYCVNKGSSFWNGIPVIVAAPVGAMAGALGGGGYFVGTSTYNMFKKGENVKVNPGDMFEITLTEPMDVPVN
jgi:hypothetical protein